jgi:hypothetical protein
MARYIFSKGQVHVAGQALQPPDKPSHPLAPTVLLVVDVMRWSANKSSQQEPGKEPLSDQSQR